MLTERQKAADIIIDVLSEKMTVAQGLSLFPKTDDINVKCAFDALAHLEADEDLRAHEIDYAEIQDEYLLNMATALKKGELLPVNTISEYLKYHQDNLTSSDKKDFKTVFQKLKRMINF